MRPRCLLLALLAAAGRVPAQAAAPLPPPVAALVTQLQPGATDDRTFVRRWFAPAAYGFNPESVLVRDLGVLRERSGGVTVLGAEPRNGMLRIRVRTARTGIETMLDIGTAGHHLMGWSIRLDHYRRSGPPPRLPDRAVPSDSVLAIAHGWLDWWAAHGLWSGTVALARRDTTVLVRGLGFADSERGIAATADTRYHLGSSNKMLTAIAALQLVAEGRLRLDDTLARLLPDFPERALSERITVRQLLTHQSGLGGLWELPGYETAPRIGRNDAYLPAFSGRVPLFEPGTAYSYSNEGFLLLGAIIERVSGESYDAFVRRRIAGPAGFTGWCDCAAARGHAGRATGYSWRGDLDPLGENPPTSNEWFLVGRQGIAAGGFYASAEDYLRLARAMRAGRLLPDSLQQLLFNPTTASGPQRPYGMGMALQPYGNRAAWGHGGGGGLTGVGVEFATFRDGGWTLAVFGNRDLHLAREVLAPLMTFLARQ